MCNNAIMSAIRNSEVSAIEGGRMMYRNMEYTEKHSVPPKRCAIERFPLLAESVKGGSTV